MGIDAVHGKVTVEKVRSTPIGDDEPVSLFRAQDKYMPDILAYYRVLIVTDPEITPEFVAKIDEHMDRVEAWQLENGCRTPGLGAAD